MKKLLGYLAVVLVCGVSAAVQAAPYAPVITHPKPKPGSPQAAMAAFAVPFTVPTADDVGIPAYPGAKIEKIEGRAMEGWHKYSGLPDLILLSTDSPKKVQAFYAKHLKNWSVGAMHPGYWFNHGKVRVGDEQVAPHVEVSSVKNMLTKSRFQRDMPGVQTVIIVHYLPPALKNAKDPEKVDFPPFAHSGGLVRNGML